MTAPLVDLEVDTTPLGTRPATRGSSRAVAVVVTLVVVGCVATTVAGGGGEVVNPGGWTLWWRFWAAALRPELDPAFLGVAARASVTTLAYAVLGTAGSIVLGLVGAAALSERWWRREEVATDTAGGSSGRLRWGWYAARVGWALPRGIHEAVWGLVLISTLGRNPLVAILAIAIPFGAITAKVFAELIDEQPSAPYQALRTAGAGRVVALAYGIGPAVARDMVTYAFYRLECSIRSSVVLGIVGAGGLGFELALSFQSLRYEQMWTLIGCLILLSALGDTWSAALRGSPSPTRVRWSLLLAAVLVVAAAAHLRIDPTSLWAPRTRELTSTFLQRVWPPTLPDGGVGQLAGDALSTLQMSITASVIATALAVATAFLAARTPAGRPPRTAASLAARATLLCCRAIPPPVWALIVLFILYPGGLPGAVALGLYNYGILGRLLAEVVENHDRRPADALRTAGAPPTSELAYGVIPQIAPRFTAYALYRWEVTIRETVIVGLVGAAGLGRLLAHQHTAFDHGGMLTTVTTLIALSLLVDLTSARLRARLR